MPLYEPREDSFLLQKYVKKYAKGTVLDMGTGSGIQAVTAAKKKSVKKVLAVDIQKKVITHCTETIRDKKITFLQSNLFQKINTTFDIIIFNPPYLPKEPKLKDLTLDGGKRGHEVIETFLTKVNSHLTPNGIILLVFSSLTGKEKINDIIEKNLLEKKELSKKRIFFEDLFVYRIKKTLLLKNLEKKGIKKILFFTKGHRGYLFRGTYKKKNIVIKLKNPKSKATGRIQNEITYLKKLNKKDIGPKLLFHEKNYFVYEYVKGDFILDYIEKNGTKKIKQAITKIFDQLFMLDTLGINKEEMHHPRKHIIIKKHQPILLDFERCYTTKKPHNVTQFCQYLSSLKILKEKRISINKTVLRKHAAAYKKEVSRAHLQRIVDCLGLQG